MSPVPLGRGRGEVGEDGRGLSARIAQVQEQRQTSDLSASLGYAPGDDPWARRSTSTLPCGTGALAFAGESRLDQIARELALTDAELSRIVGLPAVMLDRWKLGGLQPGAVTAARYERLIQIHYRLYGMFQPHDVLRWLRAEREDLGGRSPRCAPASSRGSRRRWTGSRRRRGFAFRGRLGTGATIAVGATWLGRVKRPRQRDEPVVGPLAR